MTELKTDNLSVRLRPLTLPDDIDRATPWYADPDVLYFSEGTTVPFDTARIEGMYRWLSARGQVFIIEVFDGGWIPVGDISLCENLIPIVIGDPRYRGRGVGSRALGLLIEEAKKLGWTKLIAHQIFSYNHRSLKLFEKYGFRKTDTGVDRDGREFFRYEKELSD
jgi:RimJ/RimL family protein N-acetyltransferase